MMEKLSQMKKKLFKFLPNQPLASFQNPNLSHSGSVSSPRGGRSPRHRVSIVPEEARRKQGNESFSAHEPYSPKVSCIGQVKSKKKRKAHKLKRVKAQESGEKKKFLPWILKIIGAECLKESEGLEEKAPTMLRVDPRLDTMKKFANGRGSLRHFDMALVER